MNSFHYRSLQIKIRNLGVQTLNYLDSSTMDKVEDEPIRKKNVLSFLYDNLSCGKTEASVIYYNQQTLQYFDQLSKTQKNIELLNKNGVSSEAIINNPYLLTMDISNFFNAIF